MAANHYVFTSTLKGSVRRFVALHGKGIDAWEAPVKAASPVVVVRGGVQDDDAVYAGTADGRVVRLSFHSGEVLGEFPLAQPVADKFVRSLAYEDGVIYGVLGGSILCACSADGAPLWQFDVDDEGSDNWIGGPVVADGLVYAVGAGDAYALRTDGSLAWKQPVTGINLVPVVADGVLYTTAVDRALAFDAEDGTMLWEAGVASGANLSLMGIAVAGGRVFVNGDTALYALDAATGAQLWMAELGAEVTTPGLPDGGGVVLVCARGEDGQQHLRSLDAVDGSVRWVSNVPVGGEKQLVTRPVVGTGVPAHVFLTSQDGHVYAFALSDGWFAWKATINTSGKTVYPLEVVASEDPPAFSAAPGCMGLLLAPWRAFRRGS
jgi:outer membrane protein assembly factor BamB